MFSFSKQEITKLSIAGSVLDNSLASDPVVLPSGDIVTHHLGVLKASSPSKPTRLKPSSGVYDVNYLIAPRMIESIALDLYKASMSNQ